MSGSRRPHCSWEWAAIVALLCVAFWFRTYRLPDVPPGLHHDDIKNVMLVQKIVGGDVRIYYEENYGHEPLYHWLQAVFFRLVGSGYPELRLLSVGLSMVGLAAIYALTRRLLGGSAALWTLAWQAVSLWPLFYSRRAIRGVLLPPLAALAGYFFLRGLQGRECGPADGASRRWFERWGAWVMGGVSLAACLYTYMGARVLPLTFLLSLLYLALFNRRKLAACWSGAATFFAVALILSLPLGAYLISHPEERMGQINLPLDALKEGEWRPLWQNSLRALGMFTFLGDPHWRQFVADTPVFEPLGAILFYAGIGLSLWRWRRFEHAFALLWLSTALLPAMLSEGAPNFLRPIAEQAIVYFFPALATASLLAWLRMHRDRRLTWVAGASMVAVLAFNAWRTYDGYFVRWPQHPDVRFAYNSTLLEESRYLDARADLDAVVLSGHFPEDLDPALVDSFLGRTDLVPRWCDIRQALVYPGGHDAPLIQPDYFPVDATLAELFLDGPPTYERRLPDGRFVFAVYDLLIEPLSQRLELARTHPLGWSGAVAFPGGLPEDWTPVERRPLYSAPPGSTGRVSLMGYEILNGDLVQPGDAISLLTYWQVVEPGSAMGITFVHLLSPEGTVLSGYDGFGAPPNRWISGDLMVQAHRFALPADAAPASYPIELGWYERDTGARWTVSLPDGNQVDRLLLQPLTVLSANRP